ncbi:MAG: anti-sigma factor family protein [Planctomycetota bacterium]|jgi:hypothetical protein
MSESQNIDELLNGFIDGELTARQQTEVQRLVSHDDEVAGRLRELERCKLLVGSLPFAEAPAGMAEQIKASLERSVLPDEQPQRIEEHVGARHLLVRKVLSAAAMIGLVAVLGAVVYTIVAPEGVTDKPLAVEDWRQPRGKVEAGKPAPDLTASAEKTIAQISPAVAVFDGRLELKTSDLVAVDAFINRAIEDNGLLEKVSVEAEGDRSVYALSCSRGALSLLLADLESVWDRLDSATLFVETDQVGEQVVVGAVAAEQVVEIVNQDSLEERVEVAKDFGVLNKMSELLPGKEIFAAIEDRGPELITIPKPVLTSSEKALKQAVSQEEDKGEVHLTIVVAGVE